MENMEAINAVLGGELSGAIRSAFACMEWAEEEIAAARLTDKQGSKVFGAACPPQGMGERERLYRAHVREIINAVRGGEEPPAVTDAYVALAFAAMSLASPLQRSYVHAYETLFRRLFGKEAIHAIGPDPASERDRAELDRDAEEIIEDLRRKIERAL